MPKQAVCSPASRRREAATQEAGPLREQAQLAPMGMESPEAIVNDPLEKSLFLGWPAGMFRLSQLGQPFAPLSQPFCLQSQWLDCHAALQGQIHVWRAGPAWWVRLTSSVGFGWLG